MFLIIDIRYPEYPTSQLLLQVAHKCPVIFRTKVLYTVLVRTVYGISFLFP